jgi:hypothetical protein
MNIDKDLLEAALNIQNKSWEREKSIIYFNSPIYDSINDLDYRIDAYIKKNIIFLVFQDSVYQNDLVYVAQLELENHTYIVKNVKYYKDTIKIEDLERFFKLRLQYLLSHNNTDDASLSSFARIKASLKEYDIPANIFAEMYLCNAYNKKEMEETLELKNNFTYSTALITIGTTPHKIITYRKNTQLVFAFTEQYNLKNVENYFKPKYYFEFELVNQYYEMRKSYNEIDFNIINPDDLISIHQNLEKQSGVLTHDKEKEFEKTLQLYFY